ncbi:hypothetical protein MJO47_03135 [Desulfuromonas sp. KJ2020]|uniref:hypothetical protein n=1 Tax=Desulfuromonas sp. KJ2020 TaxID=2919173 RepID=UPI0020A7707A|nr:hypothetical protein [Desulfuromonas sp. KJ2020]MCP3176087.1 hypothetical protein [Desulfuromonas sp. KJ2020]
MTGLELAKKLEEHSDNRYIFIRWWGEDAGQDEYETLDAFIENASAEQQIAGYELLDLEGMWDTLNRLHPDQVTREKRLNGEFIVWAHDSGAGEMVIEDCPYTPEALMTIFKLELLQERPLS